MVTVKVCKPPGTVKEVVLTDNRSISEALRQADYSAEGYEVRINGEVTTLSSSTGLSDGDTILLVRPVKGN